MAECGEYYVLDDGYDPRGSGTEYYKATCKKCGLSVKYTEYATLEPQQMLKERVCPSTEVQRYRKGLEQDINYHKAALDRLNKEYLQSLKDHA